MLTSVINKMAWALCYAQVEANLFGGGTYQQTNQPDNQAGGSPYLVTLQPRTVMEPDITTGSLCDEQSMWRQDSVQAVTGHATALAVSGHWSEQNTENVRPAGTSWKRACLETRRVMRVTQLSECQCIAYGH